MILTQEQAMIRETARNFAAERLKPFAAEWDREATFPRQAIEEMGQLGLMGMLVPEAYDGAASDHVSYALALEEIAAVLHPGWVRTDMGGASAPVLPADSIAGMRRVIAGLRSQDSGGFFDYTGAALPW